MKQDRLQLPVQRQYSSLKVFADQGPRDALNTDAWFPAVIKQQTIPIIIVTPKPSPVIIPDPSGQSGEQMTLNMGEIDREAITRFRDAEGDEGKIQQ